MRRIALFAALLILASGLSLSAQNEKKIKEINEAQFLEQVFNYRNDSIEQPLARPAVVDFWAPWCAPCLRLSPVIDELAEKYGDKVDFYKLNVDDNPTLAQELRIQSIPLVVFFPTGSRPFKGAVGVQPTEIYEQAISEMLLPDPVSE